MARTLSWVAPIGLLVALVPLVGCSPDTRADGDDDSDSGGDGPDAGGNPFIDASPAPDGSGPGPGPGGDPVVYAHTRSELYRIDPETFDVTLIGAFQWSTGTDEMTDIAIDATGLMIGVSLDNVYDVNTSTAAATYKAPLTRDFNGLSFLPAGTVDPGQEVLVGATLDGSVWRIDPTTGISTQLGDYGGNWRSSGDLVSVEGFGTVATINTGGTLLNDRLAIIAPGTFVATPITMGNTGFTKIWGLGFWKGKVFGFTDNKEFVLIDVTTGEATIQELGDQAWWGAGVTTSAPIIP